MAGNQRRRGAVRKSGTKKGAVVGSGGQRRRGLEGKGPTPPAELRPGHPKARRAAANRKAAGRTAGGKGGSRRGRTGTAETVAGRNTVLEALRADVPVKALYVAERIDSDDRVREILKTAAERGLSVLESPRPELDRLTAGAVHQGVALTVPPYEYAHPDDLVAAAHHAGEPPLLVALDGVTDPRNLGAVVRSAAAFGAHGVVIPERRSAGMSVGAWKTSAGAAARVPVARATNLARQLREYAEAGLFVVGLAGDGTVEVSELEVATEPLCLVVGSEGAGMSRVVTQACDVVARIPIARDVESLNAGVAAGIALYEIVRARR
ncbi:MAG TPA: 23S rRNA (guanosine(2251)-2'-O)-methyltransferase RlmB [Jiangellaceae bacterium]